MSLQIAKRALRNELKEKLKNMSTEERCKQSQSVFNKLLKNEIYLNSQRISVYLNRDIEVETGSILKHIFSSGKECFIPKYNSKNTDMDMVKLSSFEEFEKLPSTAWNIKQPSEYESVQENALSFGGLDLIIVPGLGFTVDGLRIGNGKGYYDIYLKKYAEKFGLPVPTIALAYKEQIVSSIPTSEFDMKIDEVIFAD